MRSATPSQRLKRIAQAHQPDEDGFCAECEGRHPCDTYRWAVDPHLVARDPFREPSPPEGGSDV